MVVSSAHPRTTPARPSRLNLLFIKRRSADNSTISLPSSSHRIKREKNQRSPVRSDETTTTHRPRRPKHPPHLRNPKLPTHRVKHNKKTRRQYKEPSPSFERDTTRHTKHIPIRSSDDLIKPRTASLKLSYNSSTNPGSIPSPPPRAFSSSSSSSFFAPTARASTVPPMTARDAMIDVGATVTMPTVADSQSNRTHVSHERFTTRAHRTRTRAHRARPPFTEPNATDVPRPRG